MQIYAFALRTSSSVVSRTVVSLMYAHCRCESVDSDPAVDADDEGGAEPFSASVVDEVLEETSPVPGRAVYAT